MTWKCETRLNQLSSRTDLMVTCNCCGESRFETVRDLVVKARLGQMSISAVEKALYCADRTCKGDVRITLSHTPELAVTQGFVRTA